MKDIYGELEYKGKKYKTVFNINVMEAIQDEFGSISKWGELTSGENGEPNIKAIKYGFTRMLNEAIDMDNEDNGTDIKPLTPNFVGRMLTDIGLEKTANTLHETVVNSTKSTDDQKNV